MLFNSILFILFFLPVVLAVSWLIRAPRWRVIFSQVLLNAHPRR